VARLHASRVDGVDHAEADAYGVEHVDLRPRDALDLRRVALDESHA
jgi:hypothetical protein